MALGEAAEQKSTNSLSVTIPLLVKGERERGMAGSLLTGTLIHFSPGSGVKSLNLIKEQDFSGAI